MKIILTATGTRWTAEIEIDGETIAVEEAWESPANAAAAAERHIKDLLKKKPATKEEQALAQGFNEARPHAFVNKPEEYKVLCDLCDKAESDPIHHQEQP